GAQPDAAAGGGAAPGAGRRRPVPPGRPRHRLGAAGPRGHVRPVGAGAVVRGGAGGALLGTDLSRPPRLDRRGPARRPPLGGPRGPWRAAALCGALALAAGVAARDAVAVFAGRCAGTAPLAVGLGPERQALVEALRRHTRPGARILWEDRPATRETSRWSALL